MSEPKFSRGCNTRAFWYRESESEDEVYLIDGYITPEKLVKPGFEDLYENEPEDRNIVNIYLQMPDGENYMLMDQDSFSEEEIELMQHTLSEEYWNSNDDLSYVDETMEKIDWAS